MKTDRIERKKDFIRGLAEFLVSNQAEKSILLQMGTREAQQWLWLRNLTPLQGNPDIDEAERILTEFLN